MYSVLLTEHDKFFIIKINISNYGKEVIALRNVIILDHPTQF